MKRSDAILRLLADLDGVYDEGPEGRDAIDQLQHCVQMASRAVRAGMPDWFVTLALIHDAFRVIAPLNHGPALAVALEDILSYDEACILKYHSVWQNDILWGLNDAERFKGESWYEYGQKFGELDAASFDPDYPSMSFGWFMDDARKYLDGSGAS